MAAPNEPFATIPLDAGSEGTLDLTITDWEEDGVERVRLEVEGEPVLTLSYHEVEALYMSLRALSDWNRSRS